MITGRKNNACDDPDGETVRYVDIDEEGYPSIREPKWKTPASELESTILAAVGRTKYAHRKERSEVIKITKAAMSLSTGIVSIYPLEWIKDCCAWAKTKRRQGNYWLALPQLLSAINNQARRSDYIREWERQNPGLPIREEQYVAPPYMD